MVEKAIKKTECIVQMYRPSKVRKLNFNEQEGAEIAFRCTCRLVYLATYIPQGVRSQSDNIGQKTDECGYFKTFIFNPTRLIFIAIPC